MFRIYCMENWFNLSDRPMEDTLYEIVELLLPCSEGPLSDTKTFYLCMEPET